MDNFRVWEVSSLKTTKQSTKQSALHKAQLQVVTIYFWTHGQIKFNRSQSRVIITINFVYATTFAIILSTDGIY